ncbi:CHC2 zinc finger domain-containing protein [Tistrella mobilis]|uniref:DUF7146 domain-containing protein n=1 Tax=Tistrella mobilis TaxID=171437 RepID=UPI00355919C2
MSAAEVSFARRAAEVRERIALSDVVSRHVVLTNRGHHKVGLCPFHNERTPSFTVSDGRRRFYCFGCNAHGDVIEFVSRVERIPLREALAELEIDAGISPAPAGRPRRARPAPPPPPESPVDEAAALAERVDRARDIWFASQPISGTTAERYLRRRGIVCALPPTLRYCPRLAFRDRRRTQGTWEAMVAAIQDDRGRVVGVHRTYLDAGGYKARGLDPAKKMLGLMRGGAIRLTPAAETIAISEGIETGLSVLSARPDLAVWAAGAFVNIYGRGKGQGRPHPSPPADWPNLCLPSTIPDMDGPGIRLPEICRRVLILADNDSPDPLVYEALIARAAARFKAEGREVLVAWPPRGMDFNDLLAERDEPARASAPPSTSLPTLEDAT